ncbi:MAG: hypothetical protein JWM94_67 [Sphingomonas bacterium]|nr:hypothetical protein [Sphingomonas bacterium]
MKRHDGTANFRVPVEPHGHCEHSEHSPLT